MVAPLAIILIKDLKMENLQIDNLTQLFIAALGCLTGEH